MIFKSNHLHRLSRELGLDDDIADTALSAAVGSYSEIIEKSQSLDVVAVSVTVVLSHELITEKLRGELGFDGLVVTDALAMGAIAQNYSASETALLAFKAGSDLLLIPGNLPEAYTAVLNAVNAGEINMERLNESVLRILKAKSKLTEGSVIR